MMIRTKDTPKPFLEILKDTQESLDRCDAALNDLEKTQNKIK